MSDQIFQAPPVQAPHFNETTTPNTTEQPVAPQTQPVPVQPSEPAPQTPVSSENAPTQGGQAVPEVNNAVPSNSQSGQPQTPAQIKVEELRQKLSKIDLNEVKEKINKRLWAVLGGCFLIGIMFGCSMSGGESEPAPARGLELSAITKRNSDVAPNSKLYRCGRTAQLSDACVYYIMNFDHYDKKAEDFFSEIADKTGRNLFRIQTENPTYGQQLIPPGYFAQIIVPTLN